MAELRSEIRKRLERNALDQARHKFADRIIEYAIANASFEFPEGVADGGDGRDAQGLPDVLIDQETEVMHDEFRSTLVRQGISEEAYAKVTGQSHEELHKEFRPQAEQRVKVLLVLSRVAESEGIEIADADVEGEVEQARRRYAENPRLLRYFDSDRGRNFIRSTMRRSRTVEKLIDDWLAAHPEHPDLPHADEDGDRSVVRSSAAASAGAVGVTDPSSLHSDDADSSEEAVPMDEAEADTDPVTSSGRGA